MLKKNVTQNNHIVQLVKKIWTRQSEFKIRLEKIYTLSTFNIVSNKKKKKNYKKNIDELLRRTLRRKLLVTKRKKLEKDLAQKDS